METNPFVVIDVQGFKAAHNKFICKEICLVSENDFYFAILKTPTYLRDETTNCSIKKQNFWLSRNFHGFSTSEPDLNEKTFKHVFGEIVQKIADKIVVVNGREKRRWIEVLLKKNTTASIKCENYEEIWCGLNTSPSFPWKQQYEDDLKKMCDFHLDISINRPLKKEGKKGGRRTHYKCARLQAIQLFEMMKFKMVEEKE